MVFNGEPALAYGTEGTLALRKHSNACPTTNGLPACDYLPPHDQTWAGTG
jgi:hypothetical protein